MIAAGLRFIAGESSLFRAAPGYIGQHPRAPGAAQRARGIAEACAKRRANFQIIGNEKGAACAKRRANFQVTQAGNEKGRKSMLDHREQNKTGSSSWLRE